MDTTWTCTRFRSSIFGSKNAAKRYLICADTHSFNLPADVFIEGEVRPTKAKKKAAPKAAPKPAEAADKKRSFSHAGLDVGGCRDYDLFREFDLPTARAC